MKKILFAASIVLMLVIIFSFTTAFNEETTVTVNADKPTKFDMVYNGKTSKGLTTPYEIKLSSNDSKFIFKSSSSPINWKIEARQPGTQISANWPITVLIIDGDKMMTFGME